MDLYVPVNHLNIALLGVPHEWSAYCVRGHSDMMEITERQLDTAERHTGKSFKNGGLVGVIYGGGRRLREFCKQSGLVYVEQFMHKGDSKGNLADVETPNPALLEEGRIKLRRRKQEGFGLLDLK